MAITPDLIQKESRSSLRLAKSLLENQASPSDRPILILVLLVSIAIAISLYGHFLTVSEHLWYSSLHDRNAHLALGMNLAVDFRTLDILHFFKDIHSARIWGPLHPLISGLIMAIGGVDENLAVLPSLIAWIGSGLFAFLIARRAVSSGGNLAGVVAALLIFSSPGYRAFATDVMLESLGSCLSLGAIYFWVRLAQQRDQHSSAGLGLMLSLLFFTKYNYWLLVLLPMVLIAVYQRPFERVSHLLVTFSEIDWRKQLQDQSRHPLNWLLLILFALLIWCAYFKGDLRLGPWRLTIKTNQNLFSIIAIVAFARFLPWWIRTGKQQVSNMESPIRQLVYWHCWPIVLWFLWPQRLGNCLAYLSRDHGAGEDVPHGFFGGLPYYWGCLGDHYHSASWISWLIVFLIGAAFLALPKLRSGSGILFGFLLVASAMTLHHPTLRSRFLHSWLGIIWVLAGIGLSRIIYHPYVQSNLISKSIAIGGVGVLIIGFISSSFSGIGHAPEGGPRPGSVVIPQMIRNYLPYLNPSGTSVVLSNLPLKFLTCWTYLKGGGRPGRLLTDIPGFDSDKAKNKERFDQWIARQLPETIVYIHIPGSSIFYECAESSEYVNVPDWLQGKSEYQIQYHHRFIEYGNASMTVWNKTNAIPRVMARINGR